MIRERFSAICEEERLLPCEKPQGIGVYNEKSLHRVLKRLICEDESAYEIPVGRFVADVLCDGHITEIQTRQLDRLLPKLKYYIESTDFTVTVIFPIIREKNIIRIDRETGEILRHRKSSAHGAISDILPQLYGLREIFPSERITYCALLIDGEEHRYSEAVRYRRSGRYDSLFFPLRLIDMKDIADTSDLYELIPETKDVFSASDYARLRKRKGKALYSELNFLCSAGLLRREKDGRRYLYYKTYIK